MDFWTCFDVVIALSNERFRKGSYGICMAHILCTTRCCKGNKRPNSGSFTNSY